MASGESQGKTIAIIVFVSLTAITGTSAYYFWEKWERLDGERKAAEANASRHNAAKSEVDRQYGELSERVLGTGQRAHDEVMTAVESDLGTPKTNDRRRQARPSYLSYSTAVDYLSEELNNSDRRKVSLLRNIDELNVQLAALERQYQIEVDVAGEARDNKAAELAAEVDKLQGLIAAKDQELQSYLTRAAEVRTDLRQVERDTETERAAMVKQIDQTRTLIDDRSRGEQLLGQLQFEVPDGQVVQTISGLGQAYIDLGHDDNLFVGLTFSVYGRETGGSPYELPKANLEVVRVGPKRSLARVTQEDRLQPVLAGDLLYNPVWSKNHKSGIAFVGLIYVDDDDEPDNDWFASLVEQAGGRIDARTPNLLSSRIEGEITVDTAWLVVGEIPEVTDSPFAQEENQMSQAQTDASGEMRRQARANGVRFINVRNFLTFMGLETPQRTIVAGAEEKHYFGRPRPRLVDTAPRPAIEGADDQSN